MPLYAIGLRHILFLAVILVIPIASREYDTFHSRMTFVAIAVGLSVLFAIAINFRQNVSMARVCASISIGIALYAIAISLLIDLLVGQDDLGLLDTAAVLHAGVLGFAAMCAMIMVISALG